MPRSKRVVRVMHLRPMTQHCAQDCLLSEFSSFTQCTKSCGGGKMTARRTILTAQGYGGLGCDASPSGVR